MKLKTGQKVLCVNDHYNSYCKYPLIKGSIYTIHGLYQCHCGSPQVTLKEFPDEVNMKYKCPRTSERRQSYYNWRFIPLEYFEKFVKQSSEISESLGEINIQNGLPLFELN